MYLTIHEKRIRTQESAVRTLANKYLDIEVSVAKVIQQIQAEWSSPGADMQIEKLKTTLKDMETTRSELLNVASLLEQYCITHRTIWEKLTGGGD